VSDIRSRTPLPRGCLLAKTIMRRMSNFFRFIGSPTMGPRPQENSYKIVPKRQGCAADSHVVEMRRLDPTSGGGVSFGLKVLG
jgi:hypothetical protein